jgi:hypothetical protein
MKFDSANSLKKATGRAKSDVANKLVSMFLHDVSRKVCGAGSMAVADLAYRESVLDAFGHCCLYCGRDLEHDRASVEHLEGMNRFRVGLHIPGNVAMSCRRCNSEKRRDDQNAKLSLAGTGWESFLSHNGTKCSEGCKTCHYWETVWKDETLMVRSLSASRAKILLFQKPYKRFIFWSENTKPLIQKKVEALYRACQHFATNEIDKLTSDINFDFTVFSSRMSEDQRNTVK